jgi:hypothetical protein
MPRRSLVLLAVAALLLPATGAARPPAAPERSGFTLEASLGAALTVLRGGGVTTTKLGLALPSVSVGAFVTPRLALSLRAAGTGHWRETFGESTFFTSSFYGAAAQLWVHDLYFVGGGIGLGVFTQPFEDVDAKTGIAFTARLGSVIRSWRRSAIIGTLDLIPAFYSELTTLGVGLSLEWQLY